MMGLLGDKKKMAQFIMSESHRPIEKVVPQGIEADFSKAHESTMGEFMEAMKIGEPGRASRALKQFIQLCSKEEEYSEPEGE